MQKVLDFVGSVVLERGRTTKREDRSDHMNVDMELRNFNGFTILWHQGRCNSIELIYGPQSGNKKVLYMSYWLDGIANCEVHTFVDEIDWQSAFIYVADHVEEIMAERKAKQTKAEEAVEAARKTQEAKAQLLARATRLGLR